MEGKNRNSEWENTTPGSVSFSLHLLTGRPHLNVIMFHLHKNTHPFPALHGSLNLLVSEVMNKWRKFKIVLCISKHMLLPLHTAIITIHTLDRHGESKINPLWSIYFASEPEEKCVRGFNYEVGKPTGCLLRPRGRVFVKKDRKRRNPLSLALTLSFWLCVYGCVRAQKAYSLAVSD